MLTPGEIAVMRADQEALMVDAVVIDRPGPRAWDPAQRKTVQSTTSVYAGKARVAVPHGAPVVTASGVLATPTVAMVTVPCGARPAPGDRVKVTDPRPGVPEWMWVQAVEVPGIVATACRMACGAEQ